MKSKAKKPTKRLNLSREDWVESARTTLIREGIAAVKVDRLAKKMGVTRGGFYWRFKNHEELLDALLADWERTNTLPMIAVLDAPGSPEERFRGLMRLWIEEREFSPDYDTAVRAWASTSPKAAKLVHAEDDRRIAAFTRLFRDAGYAEDEAFIRARVTYFHQVGYYAMGVRESAKARYELSELYFRVLTGFPTAGAAVHERIPMRERG